MEKLNIKLNKEVFEITPNDNVVRDAINVARCGLRQGTYKVKTRSEVAGGGRKPWRQKGTGNARQGSTRAPQWIKGGVVFAPKPRDFSKKVNKKMKAQAFRSAISYKVANNEIVVVDEVKLAAAKTKLVANMLKALNCDKKTLLIVSGDATDVVRAGANIPNLTVVDAALTNVYQIVANVNVIATKDAIKQIEEAYSL